MFLKCVWFLLIRRMRYLNAYLYNFLSNKTHVFVFVYMYFSYCLSVFMLFFYGLCGMCVSVVAPLSKSVVSTLGYGEGPPLLLMRRWLCLLMLPNG